jgi:general stress protein 26
MGHLPEPALEVLDRALVCEFTVIGGDGRPITNPMLPLCDGELLYLHSSALFSKKLEHIRANPKVSIAITDLTATHGDPLPHRLTIQGDAVIEEDDPHVTWERIMPLWVAKEPVITAFYAERVALPLFWERSLIVITPRRVHLWEGGRTDLPPRVYEMERA